MPVVARQRWRDNASTPKAGSASLGSLQQRIMRANSAATVSAVAGPSPYSFAVSSHGHALAAKLLLPSNGQAPRGVAVFLHGFAEHSGRKVRALQTLADAACVCVAVHDARGHGLSEPLLPGVRGIVEQYHHLVDDALALVDALHSPGLLARLGVGEHLPGSLTGLPFFIGGYSMGGSTALHVALKLAGTTSEFAGAFLVAPSIGLGQPRSLLERLMLLAGAFLANNFPLARIVREMQAASLNPDPDYVLDYESDPLVLKGPIAVCTVKSIIEAGALLATAEAAARLRGLPVYVMASEGDRITSAGSVRALVEALRAAGNPDVTLDVLPGARHDLLSGPENTKGISDFITAHL